MRKKYFAGLAIGLLMFGMAGTETYAASLIGHWDFEEGSGITALDSSGNALNGVISNAVYTAGKVGKYALDFNGSSSYVRVGYSNLLNPDSVGISLWFKPSDTQQTSADILDKGHGYGTDPYFGGYVLQYLDDTSTIDAVYGNGTSFPGLNSGGAYKDKQWHHMAANLGDDEIALYIDGKLISKIAGKGPIADNDSDLFFGMHRYLGRFYNGKLDDIRIYDGALSATDVSQLYKSVPVPATMLLLGTGIAGLAGTRLRRKK
jgi:hypothetical protein